MTFWPPWSVTVTSQPFRLSTNFMTLIPSLTITELGVVSMEHLQLVWHASSERLPFQIPGSVHSFWDLFIMFQNFSPWIPLDTFSTVLCIAKVKNFSYGKEEARLDGTCAQLRSKKNSLNKRHKSQRTCCNYGKFNEGTVFCTEDSYFTFYLG